MIGESVVKAPPWPGLVYAIPAEGAYMIINKTLIELAALFVTNFEEYADQASAEILSAAPHV